MLGNFICPTIAGIQAATFGWRWAYYTVGIALTALFILFLFFYEETKYVPATTGCAAMSGLADPGSETPGTPDFASHSPSDDKRQEQVCSLTTSPTYTATSRPPPPPNSYRQRMRFITPSSESLWRNYLTPFKMAVFPHVLFAAVQCANVITFLVYLASVNSIVFSGAPYNFSTAGVGLMFVGPFIGNMIGSVYGGLLGDMVVVRLARKNNGVFEPEMRLYILILPAILVGAGLMVFGVAAHRGLHWIYPSIGAAMFSFGMGSIMDVACTVVIDTYQSATAEAFVFIIFIRNAACIGIPFGIVPWMKSAGLTKMFVAGGCVAIALSLLFIPLIVWGRRARVAFGPFYEKLVVENGGFGRA
ncbi:major facilitator superfamily transporter [Purpureocillium lilacinum]|uniref:Major facilitator superfamily transporter n=2 Tax=Purpureocillium lilacinum TaxID=33203 RepID=A0A179HDF3_PURLI|nr:major facilitator superfamily transporter [Purpureocillium lilacinum]